MAPARKPKWWHGPWQRRRMARQDELLVQAVEEQAKHEIDHPVSYTEVQREIAVFQRFVRACVAAKVPVPKDADSLIREAVQ